MQIILENKRCASISHIFYGKNVISALKNAANDNSAKGRLAAKLIDKVDTIASSNSISDMALEGKLPSLAALCQIAEVAISCYCESAGYQYYIDNTDIDRDYYIVSYGGQKYLLGGDYAEEIAGNCDILYPYLVNLLCGEIVPQDAAHVASRIETSKKANFLLEFGETLAKVDYCGSRLEIKQGFYLL